MFQNLKNCLKNGENFKKSAIRHICQAHKCKVEAFMSAFDSLFDITCQDALKNINKEDRQFLLLNKKKKGQPDCMGGVDVKFL